MISGRSCRVTNDRPGVLARGSAIARQLSKSVADSRVKAKKCIVASRGSQATGKSLDRGKWEVSGIALFCLGRSQIAVYLHVCGMTVSDEMV